jgi:hypothetical protein
MWGLYIRHVGYSIPAVNQCGVCRGVTWRSLLNARYACLLSAYFRWLSPRILFLRSYEQIAVAR